MPRFEAPVGPEHERNAGMIWPTEWIDANPYGSHYFVKPGKPAIHTGADLNLKRGVDNNAPVYAMGDGTVTYSGLYSDTAWGNLIVIYHGVVDARVLYSRYGHVQGIEPSVKKGATVSKGQLIARVGNGGPGLNFDPHLHFDISTTSVLDGDDRAAGFWPGDHKDVVEKYFVDPYAWLLTHIHEDAASKSAPTHNVNIPGAAPESATTELRYVIHADGAQIRKEHSTSAGVVHELKQGASLSLSKTGGFKQDGYIWAQISGGEFHGYWVAVCKKDAKDPGDFYLSKQPPR
jgi:murein DD-endopeptidase MepM/ murein hydrolase activator NlpD